MRYLTILFLVITFLWWVLLLVSIFVSPPGLHTRGSGFFDFAYTCLTLGNLLVATIFFVTPARGLRITTAIIAGLLAIDMILILAVPRIRLEEGWVGIASAVWCILTDRVVAYGKHEEEERLTGRAETRRTLKEWLAVTVATILTVIFIVIVILMTGTLGMRARDATLKMYGDRILVDGDKYAVHLACVGNASETSGSKDPTGPTTPCRTAPSPATATGIVPATPSPTMHPHHTQPACPRTLSPKLLPSLEKRDLGFSFPLVLAASFPASSVRAT